LQVHDVPRLRLSTPYTAARHRAGFLLLTFYCLFAIHAYLQSQILS